MAIGLYGALLQSVATLFNEDDSMPLPDDFYEWQEGSTGGIRRPDAPRYAEAPAKPKVGRPRKAPKGEGYDVRARLTLEAIAALKVLMKRGLTRTDAVNVALIFYAEKHK